MQTNFTFAQPINVDLVNKSIINKCKAIERLTIGTQTDDLDNSSLREQALTKNEVETSDSAAFQTNSEPAFDSVAIQTDSDPAFSSTQTSIPLGAKLECWNSTNENLTIGLEKHGRALTDYGGKKGPSSYCNVACQTLKEQSSSAEACVESVNMVACEPNVIPGGKEVEILRQRILELEDKVLSTETTVIWQSVMIKCLKLEISDPKNQ